MYQAFHYILNYKLISGRIAHTPGILALLAGYGARLFFDNARVMGKWPFKKIRIFTQSATILGGLCDLVITILMRTTILGFYR